MGTQRPLLPPHLYIFLKPRGHGHPKAPPPTPFIYFFETYGGKCTQRPPCASASEYTEVFNHIPRKGHIRKLYIFLKPMGGMGIQSPHVPPPLSTRKYSIVFREKVTFESCRVNKSRKSQTFFGKVQYSRHNVVIEGRLKNSGNSYWSRSRVVNTGKHNNITNMTAETWALHDNCRRSKTEFLSSVKSNDKIL